MRYKKKKRSSRSSCHLIRGLLGVHVSRAMFLVRRGWLWTCGSKIGFADVLVPDAFVTAHVSFEAGDENDEKRGKEMGATYGECGYRCCFFTRLDDVLIFLGRVKKVDDREKN